MKKTSEKKTKRREAEERNRSKERDRNQWKGLPLSLSSNCRSLEMVFDIESLFHFFLFNREAGRERRRRLFFLKMRWLSKCISLKHIHECTCFVRSKNLDEHIEKERKRTECEKERERELEEHLIQIISSRCLFHSSSLPLSITFYSKEEKISRKG